MSDPITTLCKLQSIAASIDPILADVDAALASPVAQQRVGRARSLLAGLVLELGGAAATELLHGVSVARAEQPLTVEVISPGADRADELVRTIPADVIGMTDRTVALRLGIRGDADGTRLIGEIMSRNGWRRQGNDWARPARCFDDFSAEQSR